MLLIFIYCAFARSTCFLLSGFCFPSSSESRNIFQQACLRECRSGIADPQVMREGKAARRPHHPSPACSPGLPLTSSGCDKQYYLPAHPPHPHCWDIWPQQSLRRECSLSLSLQPWVPSGWRSKFTSSAKLLSRCLDDVALRARDMQIILFFSHVLSRSIFR